MALGSTQPLTEISTFMQGIYKYILETSHVSRACSIVAVTYLQFMLHVMLFPLLNVLYLYISPFRSLCVVLKMAVFCSSLVSDNLHGTPRDSRKNPNAGRSPTCRIRTADVNSHRPCHAHATLMLHPCRAVPWS
jgi:hypothetical protein